MHTFSQLKSVERQDNMSSRTSLNPASASTFCIAGFLLTNYTWSENPKSLTDHEQRDSNREQSFHLENKQNENSEDRRGLNTNSCHSSLQLFPSDRKSTRLNSSHVAISYAVFCLKKKTMLHS